MHDHYSSLNPLKPEFNSLQADNYCRNSRLVVDENDLKWVTNGIVIIRTVP